jgi:Spy/CpxP family protein refolding chaperone
MKKTLVIGALILVLASATFAVAGPYGKRSGFQGADGPYAWNNLNLTTEQAEKLIALRQSNFSQMQEIRNKLFQKRAELRLAWMQIEPDVNKIKGLQKEINDLMAQKQENMVNQRLAFRNILTPEQLTQHLARCGWNGKDMRSPGKFQNGHRPRGMNRWNGPGAQFGPGMWSNPPQVQ